MQDDVGVEDEVVPPESFAQGGPTIATQDGLGGRSTLQGAMLVLTEREQRRVRAGVGKLALRAGERAAGDVIAEIMLAEDWPMLLRSAARRFGMMHAPLVMRPRAVLRKKAFCTTVEAAVSAGDCRRRSVIVCDMAADGATWSCKRRR